MSIELMAMIAKTFTEDQLIDILEKDIKEYRVNPSEKVKEMLRISCMLYAGKKSVDQIGFEAFTKEVEETARIRERMNKS